MTEKRYHLSLTENELMAIKLALDYHLNAGESDILESSTPKEKQAWASAYAKARAAARVGHDLVELLDEARKKLHRIYDFTKTSPETTNLIDRLDDAVKAYK